MIVNYILWRTYFSAQFSKNNHINPYATDALFGYYKMMQKNEIWLKTLAHEYPSESTQQELSDAYQHDKV